jgi:hypothetical protein
MDASTPATSSGSGDQKSHRVQNGSISRKPVAVSQYPSSQTLRDEARDVPNSRGNPLAKSIIQVMPEKLQDEAPPVPLLSPKRPSVRVMEKKNKVEEGKVWKDLVKYWTLELIWLGISLCCIISEYFMPHLCLDTIILNNVV